jgi:signal peptidase I
MFSSTYSLRKSKLILRHVYRLYLRRQKKISPLAQEQLKKTLILLEDAILQKKRPEAHALALHAQALEKEYLQKTSFEKTRDFIVGIAFALCVAILIRQVWFEFYEIPSGSMRPTLKEQDRLVVSKTTFGINLPLTTKHLYFDPDLVKRGGIFIFTGEDMDIRDVDTLYFYLFPGKKQYIKRLMGKPGDTLYFYGGKMYGMDIQGNDISPELQQQVLEKIEHIPFIHFEGKVTSGQGNTPSVILHQMNEPVARLYVNSFNQPRGEMLASSPGQPLLCDYFNLWGFQDFATARLLTKQQVQEFTDQTLANVPEGLLYLELRHHPSLSNITLGPDEYGRRRPLLGMSTSIIPLTETHLQKLFQNLYTARFEVKNGIARRLGFKANQDYTAFLPKLPGVPDGTYEFYHGKAYAVQWQGLTKELEPSHPLNQFSSEKIQLLYNVGIEFDLHFTPQVKQQKIVPARYAYFRDGSLYLLGAPIFEKDDPVLQDFITREEQKKNGSYYPFVDLGPPLKADGTLDRELVAARGITIPAGSYLALGDNHAMSSDSRDFGFVPQGNVRGAPSWIFWPSGARWGYPLQPHYPFLNVPRSIIWILAVIILIIWSAHHQRRYKLPLKF